MVIEILLHFQCRMCGLEAEVFLFDMDGPEEPCPNCDHKRMARVGRSFVEKGSDELR